jgi:uncharacterized protein (DUF2147 family)
MKWLCGLILSVVLLAFVSAYAQDGDSIVGEWYTEEKRSVVDISRCGDMYCGKIVWLKYPKDDAGTDKADLKNPDEILRARPLLGLEILKNFKYKGTNEWAGGKIYDPKNGKTYSCNMRLEGDTLKVRGYIGISVLGRTTAWTRKI